MSEEALIAQLADSLEHAERHLKRALTTAESDAMVERMLWQAGKGQPIDPVEAFHDVHPDGDPYDLDTANGRSRYMGDRLNEPIEPEEPAEPDPAHVLPLEATEQERHRYLEARMTGDTEAIERIVDVIHERTAPAAEE